MGTIASDFVLAVGAVVVSIADLFDVFHLQVFPTRTTLLVRIV